MKESVFELIENYLDGIITRDALQAALSESERKQIDEDIAWVRDARLAVEATGVRQQIKKEFENETNGAKVIVPRQPSERRLGRWLMGLAAAILLGMLGYYQFVQSESAIQQYAYQDVGLPTVMSGGGNYAFDDAMTYFKEGRYAEAAEKFGQLSSTNTSDTLTYYLGAANYYSNNQPKAFDIWQSLAKTSVFYPRMQYMTFFEVMKNGDKENAKRLYNEIISDTAHPFRDRTNMLAQKMGL